MAWGGIMVQVRSGLHWVGRLLATPRTFWAPGNNCVKMIWNARVSPRLGEQGEKPQRRGARGVKCIRTR